MTEAYGVLFAMNERSSYLRLLIGKLVSGATFDRPKGESYGFGCSPCWSQFCEGVRARVFELQ
jgi:hypothetical protein